MKKETSIKTMAGFITVVCATAMLWLPAGSTAADNATESTQKVPETVDINLQKQCPSIPGLPADKKDVKGFTHEKHATQYLLGKEKFSKHPYTDQFTCTACHTGAKSPEAITEDGMCASIQEELEKAGGAQKMSKFFHNTCKTCHSAMKKAGEKTGPTSCKGCHKK